MRAASQYSRNLIEASLDPLVTISNDGKITDVNQATELATGVSRQELIGSDFSDYFTEPEKARQGYRQVFELGAINFAGVLAGRGRPKRGNHVPGTGELVYGDLPDAEVQAGEGSHCRDLAVSSDNHILPVLGDRPLAAVKNAAMKVSWTRLTSKNLLRITGVRVAR